MADIRHSLQIAASAEVVYTQVSTAAGLAQFWAADVVESDGVIYMLRPTVEEPPGRFEWLCETSQEWSGTRLLFRMD